MPTKRNVPPPTAGAPSAGGGRTQMSDIARLAGVSTATVSRALSGSRLVNEGTRTRIAELARSLNYTINIGAQSLRLGQSHTVSVIVPFDPVTREHLTDPFFLGLIGSIADALTENGFEMLLSRVDADHLDQAALPFDTGRAVGVVMVGQWHHHDQLNAMALRGVPFVVWGAQLPRQLYATVGSDNLGGGRQATEFLLRQGARRIAFLGDPELPEVGLRHAGYLAAHEAHGVVPDRALTRKVPFVQAAIEREVHLLAQRSKPIDAIFASSDLTAMTAVNTLRRLGKEVPRDIAVVGYDDIPLAAYFHPALTTVRQPMPAAGQMIVEALKAQLAGEAPQARLLPTELVLRESAGARA